MKDTLAVINFRETSSEWIMRCFPEVAVLVLFICFSSMAGEDVAAADVLYAIVQLALGLPGVHVLLINVCKADHKDEQDGK